MISSCLPKRRVASAIALVATAVFVACGVPDYTVPNSPSTGGGENSASGGSGASVGGGSSSKGGGSAGGATSATGGQPAPDLLACSTDSDCSKFSATKVCDKSVSQRCVECLAGGTTCAAGLYCGTDNVCHVGCGSDEDCLGAALDGSVITCDTTVHQCTNCTSETDCGAGTECDPNTGNCVPGCGPTLPCPKNWLCCSGICANPELDAQNCGRCAASCDQANASGQCLNGTCQIGSCKPNFGNCDKLYNNGCEASLQTDNANCGACQTTCDPSVPCKAGLCGGCDPACTSLNGSNTCVEGACSPNCASGYGDCDGNPSNGCETSLTVDPNHCGQCATVCNLPNATAACTAGKCTVATCQTSWADCNNDPADGCEVNLQTSATHCNGCTNACNANNGTATCTAGACGIKCTPGFADCNGNVSDGCEVDLSKTVAHCGTCTTVCLDQPNGTATCVPDPQSIGRCGVSNCTAPYGDCDQNPQNGCEANENTDPNNCGGCGTKCTFGHATAKCTIGVCGISTCDPGYADCNGLLSDGCEVNLNSDSNNCKSCGAKCAPANGVGACGGGACTIAGCTGNWQDCDGLANNGCEADITTSVANCGKCLNNCSSTGGTPSCSAGVCSITCAAGFGNCDGVAANGCETATTANAAHCGSCTTACSPANGTGACVNSTCNIASCSASYADCDAKYATGCEAALTTDPANCGGCGKVCSSSNGVPACIGSQCSIACNAGYGNCDSNAANGCEVNLLTDSNNCNACGAKCSTTGGVASCTGGTCGIVCNTGFANCNADLSDGCEVNLTTDPKNCKTCGTLCSVFSATPACSSGTCSVGVCLTGFFDCNGSAADGCEVNLTADPNHCGSCSSVCAFKNATASCVGSVCTLGPCNAGYADCDGAAANGCEINTNSDVNNCGGCGAAFQCPTTNGTPVCNAGKCGYSTLTCPAPLKDCNGLASDGCEVNTSSDANNCGNCGAACSYSNAAASCVSSACSMGTCTAGYGDCDKSSTNGCEANLKTDASNCSLCGNKCSFANASATCANGVCTMGTCNAGFADCDGKASNGCEVNLMNDVNNCNACAKPCSTAGGTPTCAAGVCGITCAPGTGDCDNNAANGCETNLNTSANHCGTCSTVCNGTNGTPTCTAGVCGITCAPGFGDCNKNAADGCEVNTNTSVTACGSCTNVCNTFNGMPTCAAGVCGINCATGYGNCDGNAGNGCESTFATDPLHCSSCTNACTYAHAAGTCSGSACAMGSCTTGYGDCNTSAADGCETPLNTVTNCKSCGNACTNSHGTNVCTSGACVPTCNTGYSDCNTNPSDGCETPLNTVTNCKSCGNACTYANATPTCTAGTCAMGLCANLYGDCNTNPADGCEKPLAADLNNCGVCGKVCSSANGTPSCSGGACSIACTGNFLNCDGNVANGCETNKLTDPNNCGACKTVCAFGCTNGVCNTPCTGICTPSVTYTSKPAAAVTFSTAGTCAELAYAVGGYVCGLSPSAFLINGVASVCDGAWHSPMPLVTRNGGYCFQGTASATGGYVNF